MKKIVSLILAALWLCTPALAAAPEGAVSVSAPSAILMEASTGEILYEKDDYAHLSPASVTKVMTLLLACEAIDSGALSLTDMVTASSSAASMGGSQIWLEEGEQMSVDEMLKCITVVSANDCCVALAEHIAGSEEAFVARMNERAAELGMADTHFTSCTGLSDSADHYTCAHDIAVMSRELLKHDLIRHYTTIWMDTVRGGEFTLANTNKLIYYYNGATGLKTGFTTSAMYCLSASAERDGVEYIAVVLHAPTSADRFESAKALLNYAFANYTLADPAGSAAIPPVGVELGAVNSVQPAPEGGGAFLVEKNSARKLEYQLDLPESVTAPVAAGQKLGSLKVYSDGTLLREIPLCASAAVERLDVGQIFLSLLRALTGAAS